ncbi:hypothetical protein R83H12_01299 [Fibrobacteria bacterium R8-3-H12]
MRKLSTAILAVAIAFTHVFSQGTASVPVVANINATVAITPSDCPAAVGATQEVSAGVQSTLSLSLGDDGTPILRGTSMQTGTSATYQLFSLGGKRMDISRQNIPQGIYFLSVSENGKTYTSKVAHLGGRFNLSSASGGRHSLPNVLAKNGVCTWTLTASAAGYADVSYDIAPSPVAGSGNALQEITFSIPSSSSETIVVVSSGSVDNNTSSSSVNSVVPSSSSETIVVVSSGSVDNNTSSSSVLDLCGESAYSSSEGCCKGNVYSLTRNHYGSDKAQFCDARDGNAYVKVEINSKVWMAENLNYAANDSRCYGDNTGGDSQNRCGTYGRLYNWSTAMASSASSSANPSGVQGVCPGGWHLPSDAEWTALTNYVGTSTAGTKLKASSSLWITNTGTDDYGFSALPGGRGNSGGSFGGVGRSGYWWSATVDYAPYVYYRGMDSSYAVVSRYYDGNSYLYSVRCVQN